MELPPMEYKYIKPSSNETPEEREARLENNRLHALELKERSRQKYGAPSKDQILVFGFRSNK